VPKMPPKTVYETRAAVANALGISERSFATWLSEGCPGTRNAYCYEDCLAWRELRDAEVRQRVRNRRRLARRR
jgi:hypothetical protein